MQTHLISKEIAVKMYKVSAGQTDSLDQTAASSDRQLGRTDVMKVTGANNESAFAQITFHYSIFFHQE